MDYEYLTAPCGLDCFNCHFYLAPENPEAMAQVEALSQRFEVPVDVMLCKGCRAHDGRIPLQQHVFGVDHRCAAYECGKEKAVRFCSDCGDFPCDHLHPYADMAGEVPHNTKVFNLCLIRKMGIEKWAESKAKAVRTTYFTQPWSLAE